MVRRARKIIWTKDALRERIYILDYWRKRNKSNVYSRKLDKLFIEKLEKVSRSPFIGRKSEVRNIRSVVVRNNLLVYEIFDNEIVVLSVWEGHQNPQNFNY